MKENLEFHKDGFENFCIGWSNSDATGLFPAFFKRTAITHSDHPYTMLATDTIIEVDASGGVVEIDMVAAATLGAGRIIIIKVKDATDNVTLDPNGAETIDGEHPLVIDKTYECLMLYCDGSNFHIMAQGGFGILDDLANDAYLKAVNADGDGTVNLIKANANDELEIEGGIVMTKVAAGLTTAADQGALYCKDVEGQPELFFREESDGDEIQITYGGASVLPRSFLAGLGISNNAVDADHDIDIAAGECRDSGNDANIILASAITKRIDATWAVGTNNGGLFDGTVANATWYHIFVIKKDSDGTIDAGFDTDVAAAHIPTGYSDYRRIGAVLTNGSANIIGFHQYKNEILWDNPTLDVDESNFGATEQTGTLSVPNDIAIDAIINVHGYGNTTGYVTAYIRNPSVDNETPSIVAGPLALYGNDDSNSASAIGFHVRTNTSSQVKYRMVACGASDGFRIATIGYIDERGQGD
jgi:hypothetical protein